MGWQEYQQEETLDLVEYMRMTDPKDLAESDEAFFAFILRFREYLQKQCRKVAASFGLEDYVGDEIAMETFKKFRASTSFSRDKCKTSNIDTCIKLYLARTAKNAMIDLYRKETGQSPFDGEETILFDLPEFEELEGDPERVAVLKQMNETLRDILYNRLTYKQRVVYLTYKQYERDTYKMNEDGTRRRYYLPRKLLKKLQDELGIAQSTIRKYKEEANAIIEPLLKLYG